MTRIVALCACVFLFLPSVFAEDAVQSQPEVSVQELTEASAQAEKVKEPEEKRYEGTVTNVIDGSTIEIDGQMMHLLGIVRLRKWWWGPPRDCYSIGSSKYLEDAVLNKDVEYSYDKSHLWHDARGMRRIYLYLGDRFINAEMVINGMAIVDQSRKYRERDNLAALEYGASLHQIGLWNWCPVECFRKNAHCRTKNW